MNLWRHTLGRFRLFRVRGHSMCPALAHGDWLLVDAAPRGLPAVDSLVVVLDPEENRVLVKRVRSRGNASFSVGSDDPNVGRDSRHFGSLSHQHLLGRVRRVMKRRP